MGSVCVVFGFVRLVRYVWFVLILLIIFLYDEFVFCLVLSDSVVFEFVFIT